MCGIFFNYLEEEFNLCTRSEAVDRGNSNEAEALIQVLIGRASFQQSKGDEVQLSLQNHHQLSVSANRPTGVHQALLDHRIRENNECITKFGQYPFSMFGFFLSLILTYQHHQQAGNEP